MNTFIKLALVAGLCSIGSPVALAQASDGCNAIQLAPAAADSPNRRFVFRNPNPTSVTVLAAFSFLPGTDGSGESPVTCDDFVIEGDQERVFNSLREICPGLLDETRPGVLRTCRERAAVPPGRSLQQAAPENLGESTGDTLVDLMQHNLPSQR